MKHILKTPALMVLCTVLAFGAKRDWKIGKVADANTYQQTYKTGSTTTGTNNGSNINLHTNADTWQVNGSTVLIVGDQYIHYVNDSVHRYTATDGGAAFGAALGGLVGNRRHGCRFVVGEDVQYDQDTRDKRTLYVIDADGKQCSMDILRQAKRGN